jgi:putative transposase
MWRVEPMCETLAKSFGISVSPSCYYDFKQRPPSKRALRDAYLKERIRDVYEENYSCYGARKIWHALLNEGEAVAGCTVERLMRELSLRGAVRGKIKRTTIAGAAAVTVSDLVKRDFNAPEPNRLWVADFTYVSTWEGWCCTAFVTDVFARRLLGYCVSARMSKEMTENAFKTAVYTRAREGRADFFRLIHHNDKGSQYTAEDFAKLLASNGVRLSIGSVGDSYDNALAESLNGSYKTELIKRAGPWRSCEQLNRATAEWVHWFNTKRISERNNYMTPADIEKIWYNEGEDRRKLLKI